MAGRKKSNTSKPADNASKGKTLVAVLDALSVKTSQRSILDHFTKKQTTGATGLNAIPHPPDPEPGTTGSHIALSVEHVYDEEWDVPTRGKDVLSYIEDAAVVEPNSQSSNDTEIFFGPPESPSPNIIDLIDVTCSRSTSPTLSAPDLGTRKDNPIVVDSSPVKIKVNTPTAGMSLSSVKPVKPVPKQVYSIFAPRPRNAITSTPAQNSVVSSTSVGHLFQAPYPDQVSQHVRGPQTSYTSCPTSLSVRKHPSLPKDHSSQSLKSIVPADDDQTYCPHTTQKFRVQVSSSPTTRMAHLGSIPTEHQQSHPAIARMVEAACAEPADNVLPPSKLWTEKWRPTQASHVLGNEHHAEYLRRWLCALEVKSDTAPTAESSSQPNKKAKGKGKEKRGTKRPRVVRAVAKRPGRKKRRIDSDGEDDWIVYSDDFLQDEEPVPSGGDNDEYLDQKPSRLYRRSSHGYSPHNAQDITDNRLFNEQLTNTILLTGPPGCGKTAAVYACAEELGWEVFEVYPGIGKRSGANLENLVGEVGKNYLVRKAQHWDKELETKAKGDSLLSSFPRSKHPEGLRDDKCQNPPSTVVNENGSHSVEGDSEPRFTVRQSLVLLEEVDVLFREDANFWPAVINLIKDCKRPVILTCNDVSVVPTADLPLQSTLKFEACPDDVATSFLQAVCCAESYLVERSIISGVYESSAHDQPPDLRRSLHWLQMWCPVNMDEERTVPCNQDNQDLEDLIYWRWPLPGTKSSDAPNESFHDKYSIETSHAELISYTDSYLLWNAMDTPEIKESEDDVLGPPTLSYSGHHDRDWSIVSSAIGMSRGVLQNPPRYKGSVNDTRALVQARVQYEELLKEVGHNVAVGEMRRGVVDLDYVPWMREMIAVDEREERGRGGRMTRNSQGYIRTIDLSWKGRRVVEESRLI